MAKHWTMDLIRTTNTAHGWHFFEAGALRFFRSRIHDTVYQGPGGIYFVTSEQFEDHLGNRAARGFSVRRFHPDTGNVGTVGAFNSFTNRAAAHRAAEGYARGDIPLTALDT
jgi:hypothetical protein